MGNGSQGYEESREHRDDDEVDWVSNSASLRRRKNSSIRDVKMMPESDILSWKPPLP